MNIFGAAHGWAERKFEKHINHVKHLLSSADISIIYRKSATFVILGNRDLNCILIVDFWLF